MRSFMQLHRHPEARRFIKFCIIGFGSLLLSLVVFNIAYAMTKRLIFSSTVTYAASVANGFFWNRRWTFRDRRAHPVWHQATKFAFFNLIGYCLNIATYSSCVAFAAAFHEYHFDSSQFSRLLPVILGGHAPPFSYLLVNIAGVLATGVVMIWNYLMSRFFTFK